MSYRVVVAEGNSKACLLQLLQQVFQCIPLRDGQPQIAADEAPQRCIGVWCEHPTGAREMNNRACVAKKLHQPTVEIDVLVGALGGGSRLPDPVGLRKVDRKSVKPCGEGVVGS